MKPIRVVQVAVNHNQIVAVDDKGRAWQRFADMELGEWGQIVLPDEPRPKRRKKR